MSVPLTPAEAEALDTAIRRFVAFAGKGDWLSSDDAATMIVIFQNSPNLVSTYLSLSGYDDIMRSWVKKTINDYEAIATKLQSM